jgi:hypothetical protein
VASSSEGRGPYWLRWRNKQSAGMWLLASTAEAPDRWSIRRDEPGGDRRAFATLVEAQAHRRRLGWSRREVAIWHPKRQRPVGPPVRCPAVHPSGIRCDEETGHSDNHVSATLPGWWADAPARCDVERWSNGFGARCTKAKGHDGCHYGDGCTWPREDAAPEGDAATGAPICSHPPTWEGSVTEPLRCSVCGIERLLVLMQEAPERKATPVEAARMAATRADPASRRVVPLPELARWAAYSEDARQAVLNMLHVVEAEHVRYSGSELERMDAARAAAALLRAAGTAAGASAAPPPKPTRATVDSVIGCDRCAKPCALVGDLLPDDRLCPWCRATDAPGAIAVWRRDP